MFILPLLGSPPAIEGASAEPETDIEILRRSWASKLDPMLPEGAPPYNSRAVVDACRPFERRDVFPRVAESDPTHLASVAERWRHVLAPGPVSS